MQNGIYKLQKYNFKFISAFKNNQTSKYNEYLAHLEKHIKLINNSNFNLNSNNFQFGGYDASKVEKTLDDAIVELEQIKTTAQKNADTRAQESDTILADITAKLAAANESLESANKEKELVVISNKNLTEENKKLVDDNNNLTMQNKELSVAKDNTEILTTNIKDLTQKNELLVKEKEEIFNEKAEVNNKLLEYRTILLNFLKKFIQVINTEIPNKYDLNNTEQIMTVFGLSNDEYEYIKNGTALQLESKENNQPIENKPLNFEQKYLKNRNQYMSSQSYPSQNQNQNQNQTPPTSNQRRY